MFRNSEVPQPSVGVSPIPLLGVQVEVPSGSVPLPSPCLKLVISDSDVCAGILAPLTGPWHRLGPLGDYHSGHTSYNLTKIYGTWHENLPLQNFASSEFDFAMQSVIDFRRASFSRFSVESILVRLMSEE